ncbi:hypothetical protein ACIQU4_28460 [Streptomyces sp. NPDC090741]|uniref:hypothetical protein n=1 Tax=Streptomyces sp. NPDC090741 TaxID=3365967 RepID=UPI003828B0F5
MPSTPAAAHVHVTVIGHHKVAFADAGHAQVLADHWNTDHDQAITEARTEGFDSYADALAATVETWSLADWAKQPGGTRAVRTALPERTTVYSRHVAYAGFLPRRRLTDTGLLVLHPWDFESNYTERAADGRLEDRSAGTLNLYVRGTDRDAVETRFAKLAAAAESAPDPHDLYWPLDVLGIIRGIAEGSPWRYMPSRVGTNDDVRAAIVCGLIDQHDGRLSLTPAAHHLHDSLLASLPGTSTDQWEDQAGIPEAIENVKRLFAAAFTSEDLAT